MRVSRTRFSKRRIKRKTEFPIVAVVQKKRKVESIKSLTFGILNNQSSYAPSGQDVQSTYEPGFTNQGSKYEPSSLQPFTENRLPSSDASLNESKTMNELSGNTERTKSKATQKNIDTKRSFVTPQKKSRATIDYKNVILLRNLITAEGKILPRRINKLTAKQQRYVQKAIKSARIMGLIPFINKSRPF